MISVIAALSLLAVLEHDDDSLDFDELFQRSITFNNPSILLERLTFEQQVAFFETVFDRYRDNMHASDNEWLAVHSSFSDAKESIKSRIFLVSVGGYEESEEARLARFAFIGLPSFSAALLRRAYPSVSVVKECFKAIPYNVNASVLLENSWQRQWATRWFKNVPPQIKLTKEEQDVLDDGNPVEVFSFDFDGNYAGEVEIWRDVDENEVIVRLDAERVTFIAKQKASAVRWINNPTLLAMLDWKDIVA